MKTIYWMADINGDGLDDIVGPDIQLNLGGRFGPPIDIKGFSEKDGDVGINGVGNFNGDAYADLMVTRWNPSSSAMFLGNGSGGFTMRSVKDVEGQVAEVVDFTGDGVSDLITWKPDQLKLYKGNADATFSFLQDIAQVPSYYQPQPPPVADFNEDGRLDFVIRSDTSFLIYIAQPDGKFQLQERFSHFGPVLMDTGDLNGDGHKDLAFTMYQPEGAVGVLYGDGTGRFPTYGWHWTPFYGRSIAVGDFVEGGADEIVIGRLEGDVAILSGATGQVQEVATVKIEAKAVGVYKMRLNSAKPEILATGSVKYSANYFAWVIDANGAIETPQAITRQRSMGRLKPNAADGTYSVELDSSCPLMGLTELTFEREGMFLHFQKTDGIEAMRGAYLPYELYLEIDVKEGARLRQLAGGLWAMPTGVLQGKLLEVTPTPCGRLWALHKLTAVPMR